MNTPEEPQFWSQNDIPQDIPPQARNLVEGVLESLKNGMLNNETFQGQNWTVNTSPFTVEKDMTFTWGGQSATRPSHWARWEYTPEEWTRFDQLDWGGAKRRLLLFIVCAALPFLLILSFFLIIFFSVATTEPDALFPLLFVPGVLLFVLVIIGTAILGRGFREARRRHMARLSGSRRVTIGNVSLFDQAIWQADLYVPLQELLLDLVSVKMTENPPQLVFRRKHVGLRQASWRDTIHLLIPHGHEDEARQLVERFRTETIGARRKGFTPKEPQ